MFKCNRGYNKNNVRIFYLIVICFFGMLTLSMISASAIDRYVDDDGSQAYTTIQDAINAANPGDTIYVYNGTYNENVVVDKQVTLMGEDRNGTVIDGGGSGDVVYISADWVNISRFTIKNSGDTRFDNCLEINSNYNTITDNIFTSDYHVEYNQGTPLDCYRQNDYFS